MVAKIADIPFGRLAEAGYRHVIIDLDNTLARPDTSLIDGSAKRAIQRARRDGYLKGITVVSNVVIPWPAWVRRVESAADQLDTPHFVAALLGNLKPSIGPFIQALNMMGARPEETLVIGDQIGKDVAGANRLGLYAILVEPIGDDPWFRRKKRAREALIRADWRNRKVVPTLGYY